MTYDSINLGTTMISRCFPLIWLINHLLQCIEMHYSKWLINEMREKQHDIIVIIKVILSMLLVEAIRHSLYLRAHENTFCTRIYTNVSYNVGITKITEMHVN